jgi:GH15 family glucan-1,4-alpha-glucosidase
MHAEICEKGFNEAKQAFTQYYGSEELDASVLMMPLVGFLPPSDPRVVSTVEAIERELLVDGFVLRYQTTEDGSIDGLSGREGAFLACSFWLADCLYLIGRTDDATALFERLLSLCNDVGLLSEEYDQVAGRLVGNFPQAFSHVSLVNTAYRLCGQEPAGAEHAAPAGAGHRLVLGAPGSTVGGSARWRAGSVLRRHRLSGNDHGQGKKAGGTPAAPR